jgi:hypothetical protein
MRLTWFALSTNCQTFNAEINNSSFIILADYLMIDLMHNLITRSTDDLNIILEKHIQFLPSQETIETVDINGVLEKPRPDDAPQVVFLNHRNHKTEVVLKLPLFITDVVLDSEKLSLDPSLNVTLDIFNQIMDLWQEHCKAIKSFTADEMYKIFTK